MTAGDRAAQRTAIADRIVDLTIRRGDLMGQMEGLALHIARVHLEIEDAGRELYELRLAEEAELAACRA